MMDPAYDSGVDPKSLTTTLIDITEAIKGNLDSVRAPVPIVGEPPVTYITFGSLEIQAISPLSYKVKLPDSRRLYGYNTMYNTNLQESTKDYISDHSEQEDVCKADSEDENSQYNNYTLESVEKFLDNGNLAPQLVGDKITSKATNALTSRRVGAARRRP